MTILISNIMRKIIFALAMVAVFLSPVCSSAARVMRGGTAKTNITPVKPYYPVHNSVYARALVLEADSVRLGFVSLDLGGYTNPECIVHGPIDPAVGVIKVEDAVSGTPKAVVMNFDCHPDVVWNNFEVSADYVGYAARYVEEAFDTPVNCLFIQGGAGNQAPLFKDGGRKDADDPRPAKYYLIERMGKLLGMEAVKLAESLYPDPRQEASIQIMTDSLRFRGRQDKSLDYNVHFSNIVLNNDIVIAAVPGEPFIKFQIDWKNEMAAEGTPFLFGYTWGSGSWPVYLPDIRSASLGGFGAEYGPGMIEYGAGDKIYNRLTENHYRLTRGINP